MASSEPSGGSGGGVTGYFKGLLGLGSASQGASQGGSAAMPTGAPAPRAQLGESSVPIRMPPRINTNAPPVSDTLPEVVMTPSEIGIYEVSHAGKKLSWRKYFTPPSQWDSIPSPTSNSALPSQPPSQQPPSGSQQ